MLDEDGEPARYSFMNTEKSLISIFIVLTGENWNEIMILVIDQQKSIVEASIFFMSLMILGNYMLLNLFLAILLKFISENSESKEHEREVAQGRPCPDAQGGDSAIKEGEEDGSHGGDEGKDDEVDKDINDS